MRTPAPSLRVMSNDVQLVMTCSILVLGLLLVDVEAAPTQIRRAGIPTAVPLGVRPPAVTRFCADRARRGKFTVLCPTRYPRTARSQVIASSSSVLGPSFYWPSFNDAAGFDNGDDGHLIFGGQRPPFSLAGSPRQAWPRPGQMRPVKQLNLPRLIMTPMQDGRQYVAQRSARIVRLATVHTRPALVLATAPYPIGGFMGGHVIVLWNWQQHGYMLSFHFEGAPNGHVYSLAERVNAAVKVASSFSPVTSSPGDIPEHWRRRTPSRSLSMIRSARIRGAQELFL